MSTKRRFLRGLYAPELLEDRIAPAVFIVTNLADNGAGSLRQAILDADGTPAADTIVFKAGVTGTIALTTGEMQISENLTIKGPGANKLFIDAQNNSRIFLIADGTVALKSVSISGLSLVNGHTTTVGGGIRNAETLTLQKVTIASCDADLNGGGLYSNETTNNTNGKLTISNSTFLNNSAVDGGGLIALMKGGVKITNSTISGNTASDRGGGFYLQVPANGTGDILAQNVAVTGNAASASFGGGGAFDNAHTGGKIAIIGSIFSGNKSGTIGGGIYINHGIASITGTTVSDNTSLTGGAGIFAGGVASLAVTKSRIFSNRATDAASVGGGLLAGAAAAPVKVTATTFTSNSAGDSGGAIAVTNGGLLNVQGGVFSGNSAGNDLGGAIAGLTAAQIKVSSATFLANHAGADGGAIGADGATTDQVRIDVTKSIFSVNTAAADGGAIRNGGDGTINVTASKFLSNQATTSGGGIAVEGQVNLTVNGGTFANNQALGNIGGGISAIGNMTLTVKASTFTENISGDDGASIGVGNGGGSIINIDVTKSTFLRNYAHNDAGGVRNFSGGTTNITSSKFTGNVAANAGGALYSDGAGSVNILNSQFLNNRSESDNGGALYLSTTGASTITNSVIMNNFSANEGGGVYFNGGTLTIKSTKITGNTSAVRGGGVRNGTGTAIQLMATIITGNAAPLNPDKDGLFTP